MENLEYVQSFMFINPSSPLFYPLRNSKQCFSIWKYSYIIVEVLSLGNVAFPFEHLQSQKNFVYKQNLRNAPSTNIHLK